VSQFSAVQGEDTAEETPSYQLQKEASVYSKTNCKEAVCCASRLGLQKEAAICISAPIAKILFLRDNDCRIRSLKNNGSLRELAQNMMPFQGTNLKPGITVSDMRSNSSNRNNDVNNNAARLASSS